MPINRDEMMEKEFIHPDPKLQRNLMAFGFEVPDTWLEIVNKALEEIENLNLKGLELFQVKEKFGGLRIYFNYETDEINRIVSNAEEAVDELEEKNPSSNWNKRRKRQCL